MKNILIIGGAKGIGQALAQRYLDQGHRLILTSRQYKQGDLNQNHLYCDLSQKNSIEKAFELIRAEFKHIDILINCAGVLHTDDHQPEKSLKHIKQGHLIHNYQVNAMGHLLVLSHAKKLLSHAKQAMAVSISARIGSIEDNHLGGWYAYRMSKAALNMGVKTLSIEWHRKHPHIQFLLLHPGTTDTELSKPFQKVLPQGQLQTAQETAQMLIQQIQQHGDAGSREALFLDYAGETIPW